MEQREKHYVRFFGPMKRDVMHSTDIKSVHIDIYTYEPTEERPFFTLISGGMSDIRQKVPATANCAPRAEIMLYTTEPKGWMYNALKGLAEMPGDDDTFLSYRHTVPNGKPMTAEPSLLTSYFFIEPFLEADHFSPMLVEGDATDLLMMIPITEAERHLAVEHGSEALIDLFNKKELNPVIEEHRSCLVTGRSSPGAK